MVETEEYELNELSWWSRWVDETVWVSKNTYVVFSEEFEDEYFFNRGGFVGVEKVPRNAVDIMAKEFAKRGRRRPCVLVEDGRPWDAIRSSLSSKGYAAVEKMVVMESRGATKSSPGVDVLVASARGKELQEWARVYVEAFYGDQRHAKKVGAIITKVARDKKSSLIIARIGGSTAGCAALHRSAGGVAGAYCIGTAPQHRRRGVAAAMIAFMRGLAAKEKRRLVLQTLASDSLEDFYLKQGFRVSYTKTYFERRPKARAQSEIPSGESFGVTINRAADAGTTKAFPQVFGGFEGVEAVRRLFGRDTAQVLDKLKVSLDSPRGYLRVDGETGNIIVNPEYLRTGHERHLYLDVIHELTHVRQFREGKELYDRRYAYFERPTEIEAYEVAVEEARRIGMDEDEIVDYLRVEWVTEDEFARFVYKMRVAK